MVGNLAIFIFSVFVHSCFLFSFDIVIVGYLKIITSLLLIHYLSFFSFDIDLGNHASDVTQAKLYRKNETVNM